VSFSPNPCDLVYPDNWIVLMYIHRLEVLRESEMAHAEHIIVIHEIRVVKVVSVYVSSSLGETDCSGLFTETLTAQVKTVFSDETSLVATQTTLARALSVFSGTREPNGVVCHGKMIS